MRMTAWKKTHRWSFNQKSNKLLAASVILLFGIEVAASVLNVPSDYPTIQEAVDAASRGDTVKVAPGIYYENVRISKPLVLWGSGGSSTTIDGRKMGRVVSIEAESCLVTGFLVQNSGSTSSTWAGIYILGDDAVIGEMQFLNNGIGVEVEGPYQNAVVRNSSFLDSWTGVFLHHETRNSSIIGNTIVSGKYGRHSQGVRVSWSDLNRIENNRISDGGWGIYLSGPNNNVIQGNRLDGNKQAGIFIYDGYNNLVLKNQISGVDNTSGTGLHFEYANSNVICENVVSDYRVGIWVQRHSDGIISENTIVNNQYGLALDGVETNMVFHNNFVDNEFQAFDHFPSLNDWYHPILLEGNFWSDYHGVDDGSGSGKHSIARDGIGDTDIPHPGADFDFYPFMARNGWRPPKSVKEEALDELAGLMESITHPKIGKHIEHAFRELEKTLSYFSDNWHITKASRVFDREKKVTKEVRKASRSAKKYEIPDFEEVISKLREIALSMVEADSLLAGKAIREAKAYPGAKEKEIKKAKKEMTKAYAELNKVDKSMKKHGIEWYKYDKAIDHFKHAYEHARKAVKKHKKQKHVQLTTFDRNLPNLFSLSQNNPNPFARETSISFTVPKSVHVRLEVFDVAGELVETLVDDLQPPGMHQVRWDAEGKASGVYFYKLQAGGFRDVKKMLLLH